MSNKLDINAIQEAGISLEDQINKRVTFAGLIEMKKSNNNNLLTGFRNMDFTDARIRQIACEMYSIVFMISELNQEEIDLLKDLELYILLPQKMMAISH